MSTSTDSTRDRVSRAQAASMLSMSKSGVRKLEGSELHPATAPDGAVTYDPKEVASARARRASGPARVPVGISTPAITADGEVAARVFAQLDAGKSLSAVVQAERLAPAVVKQLAIEWQGLKELDLASPSVPRELAELRKRLAAMTEWRQQAEAEMRELAARVDDHQAHLDDLPVRPMAEYQCCGSLGQPVVAVSCSVCGGQFVVGRRER